MKCKNCGGEINYRTGVCPYCGSGVQEKITHVIHLEPDIMHGKIKVACKYKVPYLVRRDFDQETGILLLKQKAANEIAERIMPYLNIRLQESFVDPLGDMEAIVWVTVFDERSGEVVH